MKSQWPRAILEACMMCDSEIKFQEARTRGERSKQKREGMVISGRITRQLTGKVGNYVYKNMNNEDDPE